MKICWKCSKFYKNIKYSCQRVNFLFLKHRKAKHNEQVPSCNNYKDGEFIYGKENCWFHYETNKLHNDKESENKDNTNTMNTNRIEVIERIVQMRDTMTERIMNLEIKTQR